MSSPSSSCKEQPRAPPGVKTPLISPAPQRGAVSNDPHTPPKKKSTPSSRRTYSHHVYGPNGKFPDVPDCNCKFPQGCRHIRADQEWVDEIRGIVREWYSTGILEENLQSLLTDQPPLPLSVKYHGQMRKEPCAYCEKTAGMREESHTHALNTCPHREKAELELLTAPSKGSMFFTPARDGQREVEVCGPVWSALVGVCKEKRDSFNEARLSGGLI